MKSVQRHIQSTTLMAISLAVTLCACKPGANEKSIDSWWVEADSPNRTSHCEFLHLQSGKFEMIIQRKPTTQWMQVEGTYSYADTKWILKSPSLVKPEVYIPFHGDTIRMGSKSGKSIGDYKKSSEWDTLKARELVYISRGECKNFALSKQEVKGITVPQDEGSMIKFVREKSVLQFPAKSRKPITPRKTIHLQKPDHPRLRQSGR